MPILPPAVAHDLATLENIVQNYVANGVAILPRWYEKDVPFETRFGSSHIIRSYLRTVAKDLRRPFVCALSYKGWSRPTATGAYERCTDYEWIVHIPKRPRLAPIVAPLIMLTDANSSDNGRYGAPLDPAKSSRWKRKTLDSFTIRGETDSSFLEAWLVKCRTIPEWRAALKLDVPAR